MSTESTLRIGLVFPDLLGTYGDSGNAVVLQRRAQWRGRPAEVIDIPAGRPVPSSCDLYLLGGGEDAAASAAMLESTQGNSLSRALAAGAPVLAVCAGMQLLGQSFPVGSQTATGVGLLDLVTVRMPLRAVGEAQVRPQPRLELPDLTGFENHHGGSRLGPRAAPLGQVVTGIGNGADDAMTEGVVQDAIIGTYLHGPVLARNPALADLLLSRALGTPLDPLPLESVQLLRRQRLVPATGRLRLSGWERYWSRRP